MVVSLQDWRTANPLGLVAADSRGDTAAMTSSAPSADLIAYRPASEEDIAAQHLVFCQAEGGLLRRHGFDWSDPPFEAVSPTLRHLLLHDRDRVFVAESDGKVVGFSAAFVRASTWFLSALFIDPQFQGRGIGRRLFELAYADPPARRITITDSIQPASNALYAKHGLIPTTPILGFAGRPSVTAPTGSRPHYVRAVTSHRARPRGVWLRSGAGSRVLGRARNPDRVVARRTICGLLVCLAVGPDRAACRS